MSRGKNKPCPVCGKPMRNRVCNHHRYHPKKNYVGTIHENDRIRVHRDCEQAYHDYFDNTCKGVCMGSCKYWRICGFYER